MAEALASLSSAASVPPCLACRRLLLELLGLGPPEEVPAESKSTARVVARVDLVDEAEEAAEDEEDEEEEDEAEDEVAATDGCVDVVVAELMTGGVVGAIELLAGALLAVGAVSAAGGPFLASSVRRAFLE